MEKLPLNRIEQIIYEHSQLKGTEGLAPNWKWDYIHSPVSGRDEHTYDNRFAGVFPPEYGNVGLQGWVDDFRQRNGRNPVVMEFMGPRTLLDNLGVPGIYVNWDEDQEDGIYRQEGRNGMTVGINADIENLQFFIPAIGMALDEFGGGSCLDMIVWKAEGALVYLEYSQEAFNYWYDTLTSFLAPGGISLIQGLSRFDDTGRVENKFLSVFAKRLEENNNGRVIYQNRNGLGPSFFTMCVENYFGGPMGVFY